MSSAAPSGVQAQHQQALDEGRFLIQHCSACTRHVYYPRELCPHCGALALAWVAPAGGGSVHSVTVVARAAEAGGDHAVVLVDLDEGVRLMGRVDGLAPAAVQVGQRVLARVERSDGRGRIVFDPLSAAGAGT